MQWGTATEALAALGAELAVQQPGVEAPPEIAAALQAVSDRGGHRGPRRAPAAAAGDAPQPRPHVPAPGARPAGTRRPRAGLDVHRSRRSSTGWGRGSAMVPSLIAGVAPRPRGCHELPRRRHRRRSCSRSRPPTCGRSATVVGIDPWDASLERARDNVAQAGLGDRITLRRQDLAALDDVDAFDCAWIPTFFLTEEDLEKGLVAAMRALRPGGWIVLGRMRPAPNPLAEATAALRTIRAGGIVLHPTRARRAARGARAAMRHPRSPRTRADRARARHAPPPDSPRRHRGYLVPRGWSVPLMGDNDPGVAQEAWRELLDVLRASDRSFIDGDHGCFSTSVRSASDIEILTHIVSFATGMYIDRDPEWPMFVSSWKDPPGEKSLGEHPDVHYQWASVRGGRRYRITGRPRRRGVPVLHAASRCPRLRTRAVLRQPRQSP